MFINLSNHPSNNWGNEQREAAEEYGDITDIPFPQIEPEWDEERVRNIAQGYLTRIMETAAGTNVAMGDITVMVSGEFTFSYQMVRLLKSAGCRVVSACTEREASENISPDGSTTKTAVFRFVQFRDY